MALLFQHVDASDLARIGRDYRSLDISLRPEPGQVRRRKRRFPQQSEIVVSKRQKPACHRPTALERRERAHSSPPEFGSRLQRRLCHQSYEAETRMQRERLWNYLETISSRLDYYLARSTRHDQPLFQPSGPFTSKQRRPSPRRTMALKRQTRSHSNPPKAESWPQKPLCDGSQETESRLQGDRLWKYLHKLVVRFNNLEPGGAQQYPELSPLSITTAAADLGIRMAKLEFAAKIEYHFRRHPLQSSPERIRCPDSQCSRSYALPGDLTRHLKAHHQALRPLLKQQICNRCDKNFETPRGLLLHERGRHHPERYYTRVEGHLEHFQQHSDTASILLHLAAQDSHVSVAISHTSQADTRSMASSEEGIPSIARDGHRRIEIAAIKGEGASLPLSPTLDGQRIASSGSGASDLGCPILGLSFDDLSNWQNTQSAAWQYRPTPLQESFNSAIAPDRSQELSYPELSIEDLCTWQNTWDATWKYPPATSGNLLISTPPDLSQEWNHPTSGSNDQVPGKYRGIRPGGILLGLDGSL